jgi:hypothetical protein
VGLLDSLMGRRKPARPNLDALFALPGCAITLDVELDYRPTGTGSVAFRAPEGRAFADVEADVRALLDADAGPPVVVEQDSFGFTWLVVQTDPPDLSSVVTDLHAVNSTLVNAGFGPQLLCSIVPFRDPSGREIALVYLYKQGTFYPFAPQSAAEQKRDNVLELRLRDMLGGELPIEPDLQRWLAIWEAPGL